MKQTEFKELKLFDKVFLNGEPMMVDDIDRNNQKILFVSRWIDMRLVDMTEKSDERRTEKGFVKNAFMLFLKRKGGSFEGDYETIRKQTYRNYTERKRI